MSLSNFDIMDIAKFYKIKLNDVTMKDLLHYDLPKDGFYVINLDSSANGGTHWTALVIRNKDIFYFDSFGCLPTNETIAFFSKRNKHYGYSDPQIQDLNSDYCGFFCLALFLYINNHKNQSIFDASNDFIELFAPNTKYNDVLLENYFLGLGKMPLILKKKMNL